MDELNISNKPFANSVEFPNRSILSQMHDIHLPPEASNWPPAPGWIVLFLFGIMICAAIIVFIKRNYATWQTKRHALVLLKNYQKQYPQQINSQKTCALINELLKKTAFFYYPRPLVASLKGQEWLNFLNKTMHKQSCIKRLKSKIMRANIDRPADFILVSKELLEYPYQNAKDIRPLRKLAAVSENRHQAGAENRSVHGVHEDSSTALMPSFATAVEFPKSSINLDELFFITKTWIKSQKNFNKNREAKLCLK